MTVLKNLADTCEFGALKEWLIRDRIVFGIQDSSVREQLLRDAKLTLETATEKVRSAELTQVQLKQIEADKTTNESISAINTEKPPEPPSKFPMIDCKFCGKEQEPLPSIWFKVPEVWSCKPFCKKVQNKGNKTN